VTNPRKPLRLNVGFLVSSAIGISREFDFELGRFQVSDDLTLEAFNGFARVGRTPQGLLVECDFEGETELECVRCLLPFWQRLHFDFTELFAFTRKSVTESGLMLADDAHLDLQPLVREYALLEIPISPLHSSDCKGLCPVCGENLNLRDCGHRRVAEDSSFEALKKLLDGR